MSENGNLFTNCPECKTKIEIPEGFTEKFINCPECNALAQIQTEEKKDDDPYINKVHGGCKIRKKLGQGGMGAVYLAKHINLNKNVAVKILALDEKTDKSLIERFVLEARSAAKLEHPNVVSVHNVGVEQGALFIEMEYVKGQNLSELVDKLGKIDPDISVKVIVQAARGLGHAHKKGLVHRDVKPENLMINKEGTVKVADFGLAKQVQGDANLTMSGVIVGTPYYISPEQAQGNPVDGRADIYSLGATFYYLLTGQKPFDAETPIGLIVKHIEGKLTPPSKVDPSVPEYLSNVVVKMMQKDPENRYQSFDEIIDDLENYQTNRGNVSAEQLHVREVEKDFLNRVSSPSMTPSTASGSTLRGDEVQRYVSTASRKTATKTALISMIITIAAIFCFFKFYYFNQLENNFLLEISKDIEKFNTEHKGEEEKAETFLNILVKRASDPKTKQILSAKKTKILANVEKVSKFKGIVDSLSSTSKIMVKVANCRYQIDISSLPEGAKGFEWFESVELTDSGISFIDDGGKKGGKDPNVGVIHYVYYDKTYYAGLLNTNKKELAPLLLMTESIASWKDIDDLPLNTKLKPIIDNVTTNDKSTNYLAKRIFMFLKKMRADKKLKTAGIKVTPVGENFVAHEFLKSTFSIKSNLGRNLYIVSSGIYYNRDSSKDPVDQAYMESWSPAPQSNDWISMSRRFSFDISKPDLCLGEFLYSGDKNNDYSIKIDQGEHFGAENTQKRNLKNIKSLSAPKDIIMSAKSVNGEFLLFAKFAIIADKLTMPDFKEHPGGPDNNAAPKILTIVDGWN